MKKIALLFTLLIAAISLNAQTLYTWDGSASTNWADTANWSPSGVPSSSDHIRLNNGSLTNMPVLDQNRSVANITITAGTMDLGGDSLTVTGSTSLTGGTVNNGVLRFNNATTTISGMTFGAVVNATVSSSVEFTSNTFNSAVIAKKTGGGHNSWNGNSYASTLKVTNTANSYNIYLTGNTNVTYNGDVTVAATGTGSIYLTGGTATSTFATGKRIIIGTEGLSSALIVTNVVQSDTAAQSLTATGATINIIGSQFGGKVTVNSAHCAVTNSTFNGPLFYTKANGSSDYWNGNTYNSTLKVYNNSTGNSIVYLSGNSNVTYNGDVTLSSGNNGSIHFSSGTASSTIAAGKKIAIGSEGFARNLTLKNVIQSDTVTQTLAATGILTVENSQLSGTVNFTGGYLMVSGSTFNGTSTFYKTGGFHEAWNNNTFNGVTHIKNGGNVNLFLTDNLNSTFNNNITVSNTGSGSISFSNGAGVSTLASGKTITVGSGGFATGSLNLSRLVQSGSTAQSITLTGSASFRALNSTFNGPWTVSAPHVYLNGGNTFNNTLSVTKTAAGSNDWTGGNTYYGDVTVTNTSSSYINLSYVAGTGDTYHANATFTKSSTGDILLSGNGATVTFKGNVTLNNISSTQFTGSNLAVFSGTAAQTLSGSTAAAISFGKLTINKGSNNLTLAYPLNITTTLTLTSGRIITTSTNVLNFANGSSVAGASNTSYVQGPVKKTGNAPFTFPTGKAGHYRPISIAAPTSVATVFTAEYKDTTQTFGTSADTSIANLSDCEYWALTRSGSSDNVNVTLSWDTTSCNAATPLNMRVAGWNGSTWVNYGNGARTGNSNLGTVTVATTPAVYNWFALGNKHCANTTSISASGPLEFFQRNDVTLTATSSKYYVWSPSGNAQSIVATNSGSYIVTGIDTSGCIGKDTAIVSVWAEPWWINAMNDPSISFKQIRDSARTWIDMHPDSIFAEDGLYSKYFKWQYFWQNKMPNSDTSSVIDANASYLRSLLSLDECEDGDWTFIGPHSAQFAANQGNYNLQKIGWINAICVVPNTSNNSVYVGTPWGGIWKTTNAMETSNNPSWSCLTCGYPFAGLGISSIVCSSNGQRIYAATGGSKIYGMGIIQSLDYGVTWEQGNYPFDFDISSNKIVKKLLIHPSNNSILFAITKDEVYKSIDGGTSWMNTNFPIPTSGLQPDLYDIEFMSTGIQDIVVSGANCLYKYQSGIWVNIIDNLTYNAQIPRSVGIDINSSTIYVIYSAPSNYFRVDKSVDNGNTFTHLGSSNAIKNVHIFEVNSNYENVFYVEGGDSHPATDFSRQIMKFTNIATNTYQVCTNYRATELPLSSHADIRSINLVESSNNEFGDDDKVFVGNDGGISFTSNSNVSHKSNFKNITGSGLNITMFYDIDSHESNPYLVVGGTQDNDVYIGNGGVFDDYPSGGGGWPGTDASSTQFSRLNKDIFYTERGGGTYKNIYIMNSSGNFVDQSPNFPNPMYVNQIKIDCNDKPYCSTSDYNLARYDPVLDNNVSITLPIITNCRQVRSYDISESDPNIVYLAFEEPTWNRKDSCNKCDNSNCETQCSVITSDEPCLSKKLYKTTDAYSTTPTWIDITPNLSKGRGGPDGPRYMEITDVAIDRVDPLNVWISFTGFSTNEITGVPYCRIAHTNDGGDTWEDYSTGLPNIPINALKIEPGTNTRIWAATDAGVYYRDTQESENIWHCYNYGLPIGVVKSIDFVKCINKIRIATHGYGLWEGNLPLETNNDIVITTNTTWGHNKQVFNTVVVEDGATLTIPSGKIIQFHKDHKLIVKPGAKLIVDGAILTSLCEDMWLGIEVWGDRTLAQTEDNQGVVEIQNGGTVENAKIAINAIKKDVDNIMDWNYCGGIIKVDEGVFKNNRQTINIHSYHQPLVMVKKHPINHILKSRLLRLIMIGALHGVSLMNL